MALIHRATLQPSKLELVAGWAPGRPWGTAAAGAELEQVAAYRFDDPAGEVGTETFVLRAGDTLLHVPLTYRGAPVPGQEEHLVGTTEHSVLGRRWCYDACADPVYVAALAAVVLSGAPQAEEYVVVDGREERRDPAAHVTGSGTAADVGTVGTPTATDAADATTVRAGDLELVVQRVLTAGAPADGDATLTGTWAGQADPVLLATARRV
jgi:Maltokinase N-terminal cap domain